MRFVDTQIHNNLNIMASHHTQGPETGNNNFVDQKHSKDNTFFKIIIKQLIHIL
jgi:hypothetical protein